MIEFILIRVLHILAIVMWIGGVGFVTTVTIPTIRARYPPRERLAAFHRFEGRFAWQARFWVLLAGGTGLWMVEDGNMWERYLVIDFWWMHAMLFVWLLFFVMLFIIEPLFLHQRIECSADPEADFGYMEALHRTLLFLALATVCGAAAGSRGFL